MNCEFCGREEALPFVCNYCGGSFCADHRLPEAHQCKGDLSQKRVIVPPPQTNFSWNGSSFAQPSPRTSKVFSAIEVRDIIVAWLGLGAAFFISFNGGAAGLGGLAGAALTDPATFVIILVMSLVTIGSGFVLHELSHKFTAQRYGYWAEFRMWPLGLMLALATSLIGVIFAAPGATYISGANISKSQNGKISIAGPLTNVGVAGIFFAIFLLTDSQDVALLGFLGAYFNILLAVFNLIPLGPLDGAKVFSWNKVVWVGTFVPLAAAYAFLLWSFGS